MGLLIYLATLIAGFRMALKRKDLLFFTFMLLITIVSASENVLDVDKGIIFYAFFFSFLCFLQKIRHLAELRKDASGYDKSLNCHTFSAPPRQFS